MLGLKLETDPYWAKLALSDLDEAMTDHAFCEQKAASNAISLIVLFSEYTELVTAMAEIAREELEHFSQVHQRIIARGRVLGRERKDAYVNELYKFIRKGCSREELLLDRLIFAAMVEARSCVRFKVLAEHMEDPELVQFYTNLMKSEAQHYTVFLNFARKYAGREVADARWQEMLTFETELIRNYGRSAGIHG